MEHHEVQKIWPKKDEPFPPKEINTKIKILKHLDDALGLFFTRKQQITTFWLFSIKF